jgi:phage/plasmid-associated DNA primase
MTLREFLRIKSEKVKKAILDNFFREYDQYEVIHEKYKESNDKYYKFFIQFRVNYDEKAECLEIIQVLSDISGFDKVPLIYQTIAYFYMSSVKYDKAFMLYEETGTEKTNFLNIFIPNKNIYFKSGLSLTMSSLSELFKEWNELNNKAGASMGQFDFSRMR